MPATTPLIFRAKSGWDISSLPNAGNLSSRSKNPEDISSLNKTGYSTINRDIVQAILHYTGYDKSTNTYNYGNFGVVQVSSSQYAAERQLSDGSYEIVVWSTNGDIKAARVSTTGRYTPFPTYGGTEDNIDSTTIFLALIPYVMQIAPNLETDFSSHEDINIYDSSKSGEPSSIYAYYSDIIYQFIKNGYIKVNVSQDGNIDMLNRKTVQMGAYNGIVVKGVSNLLSGGTAKMASKKKTLTMKEAKQEFAMFASTHTWSDEEKMMIPDFPDDFPVPEEAVKIARRYIKTKDDIRPMVNFMWRGITSYGKSTGIEAMACMLDMPLLRVTCHTNMETQQFLSDFVPDTSNDVQTNNLPDFETISYSPEQAYFQLTGIDDENATPEMCLKAYGEAIAKQSNSTPRFKHVISNYVKALINGYIVEVQEVSRIKDSGVLVGLNEYDRPGAVIPLIDGTYARRKKESIVVFTDNVGYVSCRPLDPSVIRRMSFVIDSYELPKDKVIERIKYNTKENDETILEGCYGIWSDISKYATEHDINEGSISVSELEMLVQSIKYDGLSNIRDNIIDCIISKATSDKDEREELINTMNVNLDKYFN